MFTLQYIIVCMSFHTALPFSQSVRLFLAAVTSVWLQTLLCFLFHSKHEADIRIPTCLWFPSASSFPSPPDLFRSRSPPPHPAPLLHLPLVNPAQATKHIDDLFMLGNPSFPSFLTTLSLSLSLTYTHFLSLLVFVCL